MNVKSFLSYSLCVLVAHVVMTGCATIVKSSTQEVEVVGAKSGMKLATKYKSFSLKPGINKLTMERSVDDIQVSLKCSPKSKSKMIYFQTKPGGWYLAGNLFSFQVVGWVLDYLTEEGWNIITPVDIGKHCTSS